MNTTFNRRILKSGHSLFVPLPSEAVKRWNLKKGDDINVAIEDESVKITPKLLTTIETISDDMIEAYASAVKGIQVKVTLLSLDNENQAIQLEFSGKDKKVITLFAQTLWRILSMMLSELGSGKESRVNEDN